jgi:hypothetical protein
MEEDHGVFGGTGAGVAHGQTHPVTGPDQPMLEVGPVAYVAEANKGGVDSRCGLVQEVARDRGWRGRDAPRRQGRDSARSRPGEVLGLGKCLPAYHLGFPSLVPGLRQGPAIRLFRYMQIQRGHLTQYVICYIVAQIS